MSFKVGDLVLLRRFHYRGETEPAARVVGKVGRKYVYLENDPRETPYDRFTGQADPRRSNDTIVSPEVWERSKEATTARKELRDFGLEVHYVLKDEVVLEIRKALSGIIPSGTARTT